MARLTIEEYNRIILNNNKGINKKNINLITKSKGSDKKYNSNSITQYGNKFRSKLELKRYEFLSFLKKANKIKDFEYEKKKYILQETFNFNNKTYRKITYTPDFLIILNDGTKYIEDTKSEATRKKESYRVKMKLFINKYIVNNKDNIKDFKEVFEYNDTYFFNK